MREIKFKYYLQQEDTGYTITMEYTLKEIESSYNVNRYLEETFPRYFVIAKCEYTGLQDKNGREIYEGDIVYAQGWHPTHYEIRFIEGGFCGWRDDLRFPTDINIWFDSLGCHIEVIGNIYENPELLKEQQ